jgi:DNA repair exonuclease SbcCD nuclease subunit
MAATLILPDLHIGKGTSIGKPGIGAGLNSRILDQINLLDWAFEQAIEFLVGRIILTGDVFEDAKPHPTIISLFVAWCKKCIDNNIELHIVVGNHDIIRNGSMVSSAFDIITAFEMENVYIHKNINTLYYDDVSFTLIPYRDRRSSNTLSNTEALKALIDKLPYELAMTSLYGPKVVVGHLAIEGSLFVGDEISDMGNELFCPLDMFRQFDFTWMGHIHKPQVLSKAPYISHIGSMDLSDFGETDHTKVVVIFDPKKEEPYKYLEVPTRPLKQVSVSIPKNITDTTKYAIGEIAKYNDYSRAIVSAAITLESPDLPSIDRNEVQKSIMNLGAFHIARISETKKVSLIKKIENENIDSDVNEATAIQMYARANIEKEQQSDFIDLATSIVKECQNAAS